LRDLADTFGSQVARSVRLGGNRRAGQALIESCLVIALMCLIFWGLFQVSQLIAAKEILTYAAARGARAQTVGFNRFMVYKSVRVGAIPNAGSLTLPDLAIPSAAAAYSWRATEGFERWQTALQQAPASAQYAVERARIPLYMGAERYGELRAILDYADWDTIREHPGFSAAMLHFDTEQKYPLNYPLHRAFYNADQVELHGEADLENHAQLYMEDAGW
jgi:hypothetical protein